MEKSETNKTITVLPGSRIKYFDDLIGENREVILFEEIEVKSASTQTIHVKEID